MDIGLTYDLRSEYLALGYSEDQTAEFDREETITAIEDVLRNLGHVTDRIGNASRLVDRLSAGDRWDLIFNIAEGLNGIGREAQVPAILDLFRIPYTFSDPLVMSLTLHKALTKRVVRDSGIPTADFVVIESVADFHVPEFAPPYFIKPVAEGTGKGISGRSVIRDVMALKPACKQILETYHQPVLVETFLPGREFTVGIIGTGHEAQVLGTMEIKLLETAEKEVYSYENKEHYLQRVEYLLMNPQDDPVISDTQDIALRCWRSLGCRDGGRIDIRCDRFGKPQFIEVNPLAGLHPVHSDLPIICNLQHIAFGTLIARILESAMKRIPGDSKLQP
jgi:D-alanine-D-alanine ligase